MARRAVVTGAFSYLGSAIARALLDRGFAVRTLTNRRPPPDARGIEALPLRFDPASLARGLAGADLLVNTYWVRLPHGREDFATAVANTERLVRAAESAGVGRFVHVSVSNADRGEGLGYYEGKARTDAFVRDSALSWAIVRPTLVVGPSDVLTSNVAWLLRRFPAFLLPGGARCRLQPVTLADAARIVADAAESPGAVDVDAAGPDTVAFADYVRLVARAMGLRRLLVPAPVGLSLLALRALGAALRDVVLTPEEWVGLEKELLVSHRPPLGTESVAAWLVANGDSLGRRYVNDLRRHFGADRTEPILAP